MDIELRMVPVKELRMVPVKIAKDILEVTSGNKYSTIQYALRIAGILAEYEAHTESEESLMSGFSQQSDSSGS